MHRAFEGAVLDALRDGRVDERERARLRAFCSTVRRKVCAIEATLDGLPAMAGLDSLLHDELGEEYRLNPSAVPTAQALTAALMGGLGYVEAGVKELPKRCVARTGAYWKRG